MLPGDTGSYLFGSTLPDIHIICQSSRQSTHFSELNHEPAEDGIARFKKAHPELSPRPDLDMTTRALVAGYFAHLITDKVWIQDIYRPIFGKESVLGRDPLANIMDRALQYELDKRERENRPRISQMRSFLAQVTLTSSLDFIEKASLQQWHDFVMTALSREPSWSHFPNYARRYLLPYGKVSQAEMDAFLADLPDKLQQILDHVTEERLTAFRQKAISLSVKAAGEYLN